MIRALCFIFLSLYASSIFSHEKCGEIVHVELNDILAVNKALNFKAASDEEIRDAHCLRKEPFSEEEMTEWMGNNQSQERINETIYGIAFENESKENLDAFRLLASPLDILDDPIPEEAKTFSSNCKKVECAMKEIFKDTGVQLLFMQRRFGMNGSHISFKESVPWKKEELDSALLAFTDYPEGILPLEKTRPFKRAKSEEGSETIANAIITIFDLWEKQSPEGRRRTITHELGHVIAGLTDFDNNPKWLSKSGWPGAAKVIDGQVVHPGEATKQETFVSEYAVENNWEDLAESVLAYRYNPHLLLEVSPEKYEFIKEIIFDNVEYTSKEACTSPKRLSDTYKKKVAQDIKKWKPTVEENREITKECLKIAIRKFSVDGEISFYSQELEKCYEESFQLKAKEMLLAEVSKLPNGEFLAPLVRNTFVPFSVDTMVSLTYSAKKEHMNNLRSLLSEALKNPDFCDPKYLQRAPQSFDNYSLGFSPYEMNGEFQEIAKKACQSESGKTDKITSMIK